MLNEASDWGKRLNELLENENDEEQLKKLEVLEGEFAKQARKIVKKIVQEMRGSVVLFQPVYFSNIFRFLSIEFALINCSDFIIEELSNRTIPKATGVDGVAGGEKYVVKIPFLLYSIIIVVLIENDN